MKQLTVALLLSASLMWPSTLMAQTAPSPQTQIPVRPACATQEEVMKKLGNDYQEGQAAVGLAGNGSMFQLFSTKTGSTWTVVFTQPNGTACLMAAGENLMLIKNLGGVKMFNPASIKSIK